MPNNREDINRDNEIEFDPEKEIPMYRDFKQYLRFELGMSDNSVVSYLSDVETFSKFFKGDYFKTVPEDIVGFMSFMRKNSQSIETILRRLSGLSQYFDFLIVEKQMKINPVEFIAKPRQWHKLPDFLDFHDVELLISDKDTSTPLKYRNALIMETLYATGMRVSELINVKINDIDFKRGIIKVIGKGSKQRIVPIYPTLIEKIESYLITRQEYFVKDKDPGFLFLNKNGTGLTRQHIWNIVKDKCTENNITKHVSPHTMRHSFATHMLSGGADLRTLQIFLGHSNISTTEIYTHVSDDDKRKAITSFHPRYSRNRI